MATKKPSTDVNVTAFQVLQRVIEESNKPRRDTSAEKAIAHNGKPTKPKQPAPEKSVRSPVSQYLATIGRKGGLKGGKARAAILTKEKRRAIALKAAKARWKHPT